MDAWMLVTPEVSVRRGVWIVGWGGGEVKGREGDICLLHHFTAYTLVIRNSLLVFVPLGLLSVHVQANTRC